MHSTVNKHLLDRGRSQVDEVRPTPRWKRATDLVCCIPALPVLAILTLLMSLVMKFLSPGPVFFLQERVGYRGRRFKLYKFRTMHVDTDQLQHRDHVKQLVGGKAPMVKLDAKNDSRLIPGGWLLRASGLDELPQLVNVLRGEMSLVGPRPCVPYEIEHYQSWQLQRFETLPGLTGLWQVSGKNRTTFDEMIRLDIQYAEAKTWLLDVKIMLKTFGAVITQINDTRCGRKSGAVPTGPITVPPFFAPPAQKVLESESVLGK